MPARVNVQVIFGENSEISAEHGSEQFLPVLKNGSINDYGSKAQFSEGKCTA